MVLIKVYNSIGKEIRSLIDKKLTPGKYEVEFNSEDLSSGIYFYKMDIEGFSNVKRMILLKW